MTSCCFHLQQLPELSRDSNFKDRVINNTTDNAYLVVDIGGTHIRFAMSEQGALDRVEKYQCSEFVALADAISHYFAQYAIESCDSACVAVAATTDSDLIKLTNSNWSFSIAELQTRFSFNLVEVINDFEAIAYAIPTLDENQLVQLGGTHSEPAGNMVVLGPGTGLGVKHLKPIADGWKILSGEGGHVDFAPVDNRDLVLWNFIRQQRQRVSIEDVLSGRGLVNIYKALAGSEVVHKDPEAIVLQGLDGSCPLSNASLHQFCGILGSFAGNLALNLNTRGGVFLCGGVLSHLSDFIGTTEFRERFEAKGRFSSYVENIPVFLITEAEPGLLGAALFLRDHV